MRWMKSPTNILTISIFTIPFAKIYKSSGLKSLFFAMNVITFDMLLLCKIHKFGIFIGDRLRLLILVFSWSSFLCCSIEWIQKHFFYLAFYFPEICSFFLIVITVIKIINIRNPCCWILLLIGSVIFPIG